MSGRRAGLRFDAERGVTTEALVFLGDLDPDAVGANIAHATHYEPSPPADVRALLDRAPLRPERTTFVDLGSGMGRVVILAALRPFRQVVGVEISPALHEVARENLAALAPGSLVCSDVRLVRRDAARYAFPAGDLLVYLYNPFRAPVLERVLDKLERDRTRDVVIAYHTPLERDAIERRGTFEALAELPCGSVWRLVTSPSDRRR